jgi:hypothetical protein
MLDYLDLVVHDQHTEERQFYALERLWRDCPEIDLDIDVTGLLDTTKVVAHNVARPVAPLAAFLVGYAAAQRGGGEAAVSEASRTAARLAEQWGADHTADREA